jgi:hypothetical protein
MEWEKTNSSYTNHQTALVSEERIASLFQPDTLAAAQYFDNLRRTTILEPEKRLMLAVLEDAVSCFQDNVLAHSEKKRRISQEAEEWIRGEESDWFFSFENICEVFGINPEYVRQGLLRWKEKTLPNHPNTKAWERKKMVG